jgi:DNA-binding MarR family transcriptional regulator
MTTPPAVFAQFGQTLAFAERTLTAVLREHLAERDATPETWYVFQLVSSRGPEFSREALIGDLAGSPNLDAASAAELLARLEAEGLIRGDTHVEMTARGDEFYRSLREHVLGGTARLLGQFEIRDIETTVRTMRAITQRAAEEQAVQARATPAEADHDHA